MLKPIHLVGEQKRILFLPPQNPIQIKGVAGCGKTTVAIYRAKHLVKEYGKIFQEPNVIIFTYNKSLVNYIKQLLPDVLGGYQQNTDELQRGIPKGLDVTVTNFHKWTYGFLKSRGYKLRYNIASEKLREEYIDEGINTLIKKYPNSKILYKRVEFFKDEISWMKGKLFNNNEEYFSSRREGRGKVDRVTNTDKEVIWELFSIYERRLKQEGKFDFDDFAKYALGEIVSDSVYKPPYTHIVIDEAQDLNKAQIMVLYNLVSRETNSITIIADLAQRIYKSGFTWNEVGINVTGNRTVELKNNYRNTIEIAQAAISLLKHDDDNSEFLEILLPSRHGEKPVLGSFNSREKQISFLADKYYDYGGKNKSTVLLSRNGSQFESLVGELESRGISCVIIGKHIANFSDWRLMLCTLSSIKGLEFDNVFIMDLNQNVIPSPNGFNEINDELHINTERRLLYTAMTRAKERLFLTYWGQRSRFIDELNHSLFNHVDSNYKEKYNFEIPEDVGFHL